MFSGMFGWITTHFHSQDHPNTAAWRRCSRVTGENYRQPWWNVTIIVNKTMTHQITRLVNKTWVNIFTKVSKTVTAASHTNTITASHNQGVTINNHHQSINESTQFTCLIKFSQVWWVAAPPATPQRHRQHPKSLTPPPCPCTHQHSGIAFTWAGQRLALGPTLC